MVTRDRERTPPQSLTFPGVYVDEVPSSVRTIIGVPTSTAAFVGLAVRGPVDTAVHITSWADFERVFGGLSVSSTMSYAVYHYYLNGGAEGEIVRVKRGGAATAGFALGGLRLLASSPGAWGNKLRLRVDYNTNPEAPDPSKIYNLTVRDTLTGAEERFANVSVETASTSSIDTRLRTSSLLKFVSSDGNRPPKSDDPAGPDPFADAPAGPPPAVPPPAPAVGPFYTSDNAGNDGEGDPDLAGSEATKEGIYALLETDIFNLLVMPPADPANDHPQGLLTKALNLCVSRRAIVLVDPPTAWTDVNTTATQAKTPPVSGSDAKNAVAYYPRIKAADPLQDNALLDFAPSGAMAGVIARTDSQRGVWKAPAGTDASVNGAAGLTVKMTDLQNDQLNPLGVNCLRTFPVIGTVAWGARTLRGADAQADQWKFLPVRRLALFIEESLDRGTKWVVFEPNDEPLWASIRLSVGAFMNNLFRQGAFQGPSPQVAYLVKCDKDNNPQNDIDRGIVNILVGFAPLKPAEFVLIHIQQLSPQPQA